MAFPESCTASESWGECLSNDAQCEDTNTHNSSTEMSFPKLYIWNHTLQQSWCCQDPCRSFLHSQPTAHTQARSKAAYMMYWMASIYKTAAVDQLSSCLPDIVVACIPAAALSGRSSHGLWRRTLVVSWCIWFGNIARMAPSPCALNGSQGSSY